MKAFIRISSVHAAVLAMPCLLLLGACEDKANDQPPGDISASEARALDDAADMIRSGRPGDTGVTPAGNGDGKVPVTPAR